jgi:putative tryptophan/tyrosine transport system substrate-binding protein
MTVASGQLSVIRQNAEAKMMNGKIVVLLTTVLLITAPPIEAQQPKKIPRIGFITAAGPEGLNIEAFRQGLRDLGYVEGKNILIEYRYAEGKLDRLTELAAELVRLRVDMIVTSGNASVRAAKEATTTIPIVVSHQRSCRTRACGQPSATGR